MESEPKPGRRPGTDLIPKQGRNSPRPHSPALFPAETHNPDDLSEEEELAHEEERRRIPVAFKP
jgi:hypothetical protein